MQEKWVWVVTPESTPALSRVFSNQEDAENCFREMVKTYGLVDFGESEDARIEEALQDGCGYDAPGSFAAWLSKKTAMHAWKMPGVRYDIGDLESYRKVNERMR